MKRVLLLFISLILIHNTSSACEIELYPSTYYATNQELISSNIISKSSCNSEVQQKLTDLLAGHHSGTIFTKHLSKILEDQLRITVELSPNKIIIAPLSQLVFKHYLKKNQSIVSAHIKFNDQPLHISNKQKAVLQIPTTKLPLGKQSIKLKITNINTGMHNIVWLELHSQIKISVATTTSQIMNYSPLTGLVLKEQLVDDPTLFVTNLKRMKFFQSRRSLSTGTPLRHQDIHPRTLVKVGIPTKVILKNKNITLTTMALPYQNGYFGKEVTLRNIKSGKKITGLVSGNNEVVIKL
jgi:flagella basal body P-ring formation protein FlgA